ncbi:hypothetical protein ABVG11_34365 [Streptomyces sp. HD1123-B1]|uniref:hypothetical protein n=1 Tax=Streptomyces huangiella TaxID=3228804 RepID=UPI003D7D9B74
MTLPTPLDLARLHSAPAAAADDAPAPPATGWDRAVYAHGILRSTLHPYARLVALTLAELADDRGMAPSRIRDLAALQDVTGITTSTRARVSMANLRRCGWVWTTRSLNCDQFGEIHLITPKAARSRAAAV